MGRFGRARIRTLLLALAASGITSGSASGDVNGFPLCTAPGDQLGPVAVSDGAGGAIVAWHDGRPTVAAGGVCFAQRVSAAGVPLWTSNGVQLSTTGDPGEPGGPVGPAIDSDGVGGAFLAYGGNSSQSRAQWVNGSGVAQWGADGVQLTNASSSMRHVAIVRDVNGAGGAIVVWRQDNGAGGTSDVYAQKVNAAGTIQWGASGAPVATTNMNNETHPVLISDGAGGAIVVWFNGTDGCRAQRLNSAGVPQWSNTPLSSLSNNRRPAIVSDGSGGAVVAWAAGNTGIFVQRVTSAGNRQWSPNNTGVQLCTQGNQCSMIPDGAGGATVAWQDFGGQYNIFAQRVNGAGTTQWVLNGVEVCFVPNDQLAPTIVSDGGTGAILAWYDGRTPASVDDIYAQRIDAAGASQWTLNGVPLCTAANSQQNPTIAADGAGGAFVSWQDRRSGTHDDIYFHHLRSSGEPLSVPGQDPASSIGHAWPNPFVDRVQLAFALPAAATARLEIFDVRGRSIRAYEPEHLTAGDHALTWDGRTSEGRLVGRGIYFMRVIGPGLELSRVVVRLE